MVHNSETIRIKFFMDILIECKFPVMLIGLAGSGKTLMLNDKLGQLDEEFLIANVPFNFYYSAELTQKIFEKGFLNLILMPQNNFVVSQLEFEKKKKY